MSEPLVKELFDCRFIDKCFFVKNGKMIEISKKFEGNMLIITEDDIKDKKEIDLDENSKILTYFEYQKLYIKDGIEEYIPKKEKINDHTYSFNDYTNYDEIKKTLSENNVTSVYFFGQCYNYNKINLNCVQTVKISDNPIFTFRAKT